MGGSQEAAADLAEALSGSHAVHVLTTDFAGHGAPAKASVTQGTTYKGALVTRLPARSLRKVQFSPFLRQWRQISTLVRNSDAIFISDLRTFMNLVVAMSARQAGIPYGLLPWGSGGTALGKWQRLRRVLWDRFIGRLVVAGARSVFAQTKLEVVDLERLPGTKRIDLIPLGVSLASLPEPILSSGDFSEGPLRVVCIARLHALKNIEVLVQAVAKLDSVELDVIGADQGALSDLVSLVAELDCADKVRLLGPIYPPFLYESLVAYECVLLLPEYNEGTSRGVLLACWFGCAPIVSAQADLPGLHDYGCGWRAEPNVESVAKSLREALAEKRSGKLMSRRFAAMRMVREVHDIAFSANLYLQALA